MEPIRIAKSKTPAAHVIAPARTELARKSFRIASVQVSLLNISALFIQLLCRSQRRGSVRPGREHIREKVRPVSFLCTHWLERPIHARLETRGSLEGRREQMADGKSRGQKQRSQV